MANSEPTSGHRVSFTLSNEGWAKLQGLSERYHRPVRELVRLGLGMVDLVLNHTEQNRKIIVTTPDGTALKEICLPEP